MARGEQFDRRRFTSQANENWYNSKVDNPMLVERSVDSLLDEQFQITQAFDFFGWSSLLTLTGAYYPDLVKEFYSNLARQGPRNYKQLKSMVRGHQILIRDTDIAEFLEAPNLGSRLQSHHTKVYNDPDWTFDEALVRANIPRASNSRVFAKHLPARERLLLHLFSHNLTPRSTSGMNEIRVGDLYLLETIRTRNYSRVLISLPQTIIDQILQVVTVPKHGRNFVFPILISRFLIEQGVPILDTTSVLETSANEVVGFLNLSHFGYILTAGEWIHREVQHRAPPPANAYPSTHAAPSTSAPPVVEDTDLDADIDEEAARLHQEHFSTPVEPTIPAATSTHGPSSSAPPPKKRKKSLLRKILRICRNVERDVAAQSLMIENMQQQLNTQQEQISSIQQALDQRDDSTSSLQF